MKIFVTQLQNILRNLKLYKKFIQTISIKYVVKN